MNIFFRILLGILAGHLVGAGVNYIADTMPVTRSLRTGSCRNCGQFYSFKRYFLFSGCDNCLDPIPRRNWVTFVSLSLIFLWIFMAPYHRLGIGFNLVVVSYFFLVAVIDFEHRLILHPISLFGALVMLVIGWNTHGILSTLEGGIAGLLSMLALYVFGFFFLKFYNKIKGIQTDEVALGFGDVILSGIIGLLLGFPGVFGGLILGILLGGVISGGVLFVSRIKGTYQPLMALPYAPFLIAGTLFLILRIP